MPWSAESAAGRRAQGLQPDKGWPPEVVLRCRRARGGATYCAWARVHAEHPRVGELGARSIELEKAPARRSAQ